jgi:hypothetical protein
MIRNTDIILLESSSRHSEPQDAHPLRFILIHGTWGRGFFPKLNVPYKKKSWIDIGSEFASQLLSSFRHHDTAIYAFHWSGSNSIIERNSAATALRGHIRELLKKEVKSTFVLIAHSHGGNVALMAMEPSFHSRVLVITLGTPFLRMSSSRVTVGVYWLTVLCYLVPLAALSSLVVAGTLAADTSLLVTTIFLLAPPFERGVTEMAINDPVFFLVYWVVLLFTAWSTWRAISLISQIARHKADLASSRYGSRLRDLTNYEVRSNQRLLVLRSIQDEAALSLGIASAIIVLRRLWQSMMRTTLTFSLLIPPFIGFFAMTGYISRFGFALPIVDYLNVNFSSLLELVKFLLTGVLSLGLSTTAVGLISSLFRTCFGRELIWLSDYYEVDATAAPDIDGQLTISTLEASTSLGGLRHRLYENSGICAQMANWIGNKLNEKVNVP